MSVERIKNGLETGREEIINGSRAAVTVQSHVMGSRGQIKVAGSKLREVSAALGGLYQGARQISRQTRDAAREYRDAAYTVADTLKETTAVNGEALVANVNSLAAKVGGEGTIDDIEVHGDALGPRLDRIAKLLGSLQNEIEDYDEYIGVHIADPMARCVRHSSKSIEEIDGYIGTMTADPSGTTT